MVDLLALLLGNTLQCKNFSVLQVGVLLSFLAWLKDFARTKSCCTIPLPYIRADDFQLLR